MGHAATVADLFALSAVDATVDWARVDPDSLGGFRPVASNALAAYILCSGEDFV